MHYGPCPHHAVHPPSSPFERNPPNRHASIAPAGKSSVAQQLAARINVPNVMQTDVLCDLLRAGEAADLARQTLWARADLGAGGGGGGGDGAAAGGSGGGKGGGNASLLAEFKRECRVVRQAMQGDLVKVRGRPRAGVLSTLRRPQCRHQFKLQPPPPTSGHDSPPHTPQI